MAVWRVAFDNASTCQQCLVWTQSLFFWTFEEYFHIKKKRKSLTVCLGKTNFLWLSSFCQGNDLVLIWSWIFFCRGNIQYVTLHFAFRIKIIFKNSRFVIRTELPIPIFLQLSLCSDVKFFNTILLQTFPICKYSVKIWYMVKLFKFNGSFIILLVQPVEE